VYVLAVPGGPGDGRCEEQRTNGLISELNFFLNFYCYPIPL
jgi:hypothetical protein